MRRKFKQSSQWLKESQIKSQFAAIKKAQSAAATMGAASGSGADGAGGNITDAEVRNIASMANNLDVDDDEIDAILEAVQIEEYERNVELAQG